MSERNKLQDVALTFLKLGCISFGGPAAHIALMEQEIVGKKQWINRAHFVDLIGATNLIPGPNSTEMTMHCGYERAGRLGLFVAGSCFILPAVVITALFAWFYKTYGQLPQLQWLLAGITPVILAIIIKSAYTLARQAVKTRGLWLLLLLTIVACLGGLNEIAVLFGAGFLYMFYTVGASQQLPSFLPFLQILKVDFIIALPVRIFLIFLKIGGLLYGSGYVLFAFLKSELVDRNLITQQQLVDAIAVGHFTPGPLFSTATFIGWQLDGLRGAVLATVGIFLPSFFFVWLANPLIPRLRGSRWMSAFLDGVNAAAVGLIIFVAISIGKNVLPDWRMVGLFVLSSIVLFFIPKMNSAFLILAGGLAGYVMHIV
jgi:chromate transporter